VASPPQLSIELRAQSVELNAKANPRERRAREVPNTKSQKNQSNHESTPVKYDEAFHRAGKIRKPRKKDKGLRRCDEPFIL
jgi:hypothetical protein